jgi:hypothetical protein
MVEVKIEEMYRSDRSRPKDYERAVVVEVEVEEEQGRPLQGVNGEVYSKRDLTGPTLLEMSG